MKNEEAYRALAATVFPAPDERKVYVICGAPGAGKSTYVKSKATERDLVVDLDCICAALHGSAEVYKNDDKWILDSALRVETMIHTLIKDRSGKWENAFVTTARSKGTAADMARALHGELIIMPSTKEQCVERINADKRRQGKTELFISLVERWFDDASNSNPQR